MTELRYDGRTRRLGRRWALWMVTSGAAQWSLMVTWRRSCSSTSAAVSSLTLAGSDDLDVRWLLIVLGLALVTVVAGNGVTLALTTRALHVWFMTAVWCANRQEFFAEQRCNLFDDLALAPTVAVNGLALAR